jgi:mRNA interferase MazF
MDITKYKRGQVWWQRNTTTTYLTGVQGGSRPVIIVSNDMANRYSQGITVVPLTTADKKSLPTHVNLVVMQDKQSIALCEQIKTVGTDTFGDYVGTLSDTKMTEIEGAILIALGFKPVDIQAPETVENMTENVITNSDFEELEELEEEKPIEFHSSKAKRFSKREREMILRYLQGHSLTETAKYFSEILNLDYKKLYSRLAHMKRLVR